MKHMHEIIVAVLVLLIMASLVFHGQNDIKKLPTPPESFYIPHDRAPK
jgi:hypothetical protein